MKYVELKKSLLLKDVELQACESSCGHLEGRRTALTEEIIIEIFKDERPNQVIAKDYGISRDRVYSIKIGRTYTDITENL